jgi:hypothetical protein
MFGFESPPFPRKEISSDQRFARRPKLRLVS